MKTKFSAFIKNWLLHFGGIIFIVNFYDSIDFILKTSRFGAFRYDREFSNYTVWQRIIHHNFEGADDLYVLIFTLWVELLYRFIFKKYNWLVFISSAIVSCLLFLFLFFTVKGTFSAELVQQSSVLIAYMVGYALLREFFHHKLYLLNVRLGRSQTELQVLKQQLDPHFLFNTLNYLYGTALTEKAERTAEGIDIMSGMMRYTLTGAQTDLVPLTDEIHFIEQYIYLQKVRLTHNEELIRVNIDTAESNYKIAPMLLIPFIENAFKHGISNEKPEDIIIDISTKVADLSMVVTNAILTGHTVKGTQSGLSIAKKRLALVYPDRHQLQITTDNNQYKVTLTLTLQPSK